MKSLCFQKIWYLPSPNQWGDCNPLAYRDVGVLIVKPSSIEFHGRTTKLVIEGIRRVSCVKQGRDFINKWVQVDYGDANGIHQVFFADGRCLGWSGIFGGTKNLYRIISKVKNGSEMGPVNRAL